MGSSVEVLVPDIGDFEGVEVIEVLVAPGDRVARDASLITIESDKASMEIPAPRAGVVREIAVGVGSRVSQGSLILRLEPEGAQQPERSEAAAARAPARQPEHSEAAAAEALAQQPERAASASAGEAPQLEAGDDARAEAVATPRLARSFTPSDRHAEVVVLGAGPGGYTAAFRAADLGKQVVLVERYATLGGVCLNVGCIPSKALLHIAEVISDARALRERGVEFGEPRIDLARVRESVAGVVGGLTRSLGGLAQRRKISVLQGLVRFSAPDQISIETAQGATTLSFEDCIIAAGSQAVELPGIAHDDPRVMDSTAALRLDEIPARLLVIGGGIIGLELAAVYHALGSRISIVELTDELLPGVDRDLVKPLQKHIAKRYERIRLGTRVARVEPERNGVLVQLEGGAAPASERFDRVLVAVGRRPNGHAIEARKAGVAVDARGFIPVDARMRTNVPHIYAVGDIVGQPMLAHKASHEGKTAAEVIAGLPAAFDPKAIPSVAYTDPEIAWMGLSEAQARTSGIDCEATSFPWAASGRAQGTGRSEGVTKLIFDPHSRRLLGAGITGRHAGELIAEAVLALELGADAEDLALTIHAHPTLSETLYFASEMFEGTITDLYLPRRAARSGRT